MTIHPIRKPPGDEPAMSKDAEGKILEIYDKSKPEIEHLFDSSNWNHLAWVLVCALVAAVFWLSIALVNAENQRNALVTNRCADPIFKGEIDRNCLVTVSSREHWWQNWWYGVTHIRPEQPETPRR